MTEMPNKSLPISAEILGLSDVIVENVKIDLAARKITIQVRSTKEEILCRICHKPTNPYGMGRPLQLRHLSILGKETTIEITPRRGRCSSCDGGPTTTQRLDWYDINSKFTKPYEYLWNGLSGKAIKRLQSIRDTLKDDKKRQDKVQLLLTYIENNADFIVNYQKRQDAGLVFTSQMAESTVESLINQRCKGQQHMRWSREGLHALLQIRAAVNSNDWNDICEHHINEAMYHKAA